MADNEQQTGPISLIEEAKKVSAVPEELPARDRARLDLAKYILTGSFVLLLVAIGLMILGPLDRAAEAKLVFEFVKTMVPPIVTLVLGFYFRSEGT